MWVGHLHSGGAQTHNKMPVWSWGSDVYGRLGHGTEDRHLSLPTEVKALADKRLRAVTIGSAQNVVVDSHGQVYTWGKCHYGQLGHGEMDQNELLPRAVEALNGVKIEVVGAGDSHVLAITDQGRLFSWGVGFYGCLGHGDETSLAVPKLVEKFQEEKLTSATGGAFHSLALNTHGQLFVWGRNHLGQLGLKPVEIPDYSKGGKATKLVRLNQKTPTELKLPCPATMVSACNDHSLVLLSNGTVLSFGDNEHGQLGREQTATENIEDFVIDSQHFKSLNGTTEKVVFISAGYTHCAAITESGLLYTWGGGAHGELGLGHTRGARHPTLVASERDLQVTFVQVCCGDQFTVALTSSGMVWTFGSDYMGKLGVGGTGGVAKPKQLLHTMNGVNGICCGTNHTLAHTLEE